MRFVDKATPQQLQQMVAARDPYSYMALSKLQEIRDNKLKADAKQPEAPPLAQTIPQQLAQLDQPQGIAALPQGQPAMPQGQQAPQDMPQEMQQASGIGPAMAPTGAGGGLVSFKHGGIAHFFEGKPVVGANPGEVSESTVGAWWRSLPANQSDAYAQSPAGIADSASFADLTKKKNAILETLTPFTAMTKTERAQREAALVNVNEQIDSIRTRRQNLGASAPAVTPTPVSTDAPAAPPTNSTMNSNPGAFSFVGGQRYMTPVAAAPKAPAVPGSTGLPGMGMFNKEIDTAAKAQIDALAANKLLIEGNRYDKEAVKTARGDFNKESDAEYERLKLMFPDPNSEARKKLDAAQKENESETKQAPYQGLLKMSLALMGTKSPDFLQALGNAGGEGLQEYKSINENNKKRRDSLLAADAQMSAAQDARSRGLYTDSRNYASQAQQSRMQALLAERQANTDYVGLIAGLNLANANVSANKISLKMDAMKTMASITQAMKPPDAILTMQFLEKYPQFKKEMQDQKTVQDVVDQVGRANATWEQDKKIAATMVANNTMTAEEFRVQYGEAAKDRYLDNVRLEVLKSTSTTRDALSRQRSNPRPFPNVSLEQPSLVPSYRNLGQ